VRDYLSPKHIKEHGLAEILEAMEVADNNKRKKQLLSYLWPNTNQNFSITFLPFKREKPGVQNEYENQGDSSVSVGSSEFSGLVVATAAANASTCSTNAVTVTVTGYYHYHHCATFIF